MTTNIVFGLVLVAYALTWVPGKYRPAWTQRLNSWRAWIGLVALIIAILIVMTPEFYALGILGDSAFFDLLVLAIACQLQTVGAQVWSHLTKGFTITRRFIAFRAWVVCSTMILVFADIVSAVQKVVHKISS